MKTDEIENTIKKHTGWQTRYIVDFCRANQVKVTRQENLLLLDYIDNISKDDWNDFNKSCRGLVLDVKAQRVVSYPFSKFTSYNTEPHILEEDMQRDAPLLIMKKYDGTMLSAFGHENQVLLATRSAFTNQQIDASYLLIKQKYSRITDLLAARQLTLIFEYVSPTNKIHVDYDDSDLILLGARDVRTGELLAYEELDNLAKAYALRLVDTVEMRLKEIVLKASEDESV